MLATSTATPRATTRRGAGALPQSRRRTRAPVAPVRSAQLQYLGRIFAYAIRLKYYTKANPADWDTLVDLLPDIDGIYRRKNCVPLPYNDVGRFLQAVRSYEDRSDRKTGRTNISYVLEVVVLTGCVSAKCCKQSGRNLIGPP